MNKLVENPDHFNMPDGDRLSYYEGYTFGYWRNKLYISQDLGRTHGDMQNDFGLNMGYGDARDHFKYPGRFWVKEKVISFWRYPKTSGEMKKICDALSKLFRKQNKKSIDIWNTYSIDVIKNKKSGKIRDTYTNDWGDIPNTCEMEIIPVKSYKSSLDRSPEELRLPHVMSPAEKARLGLQLKAKGFGAEKRFNLPTKYASKVGKIFSKRDIPPTLMHQLQQTSDSVIKLKGLVENTIAKVSKDINVKIDIDKTIHAGERQYRHEEPISDKQIIDIVALALPDIANELIFDDIHMGEYILIKQFLTDINVVGALHPGNNDEIDFVVVTVMRKKDFMPKKGTHVIEV